MMQTNVKAPIVYEMNASILHHIYPMCGALLAPQWPHLEYAVWCKWMFWLWTACRASGGNGRIHGEGLGGWDVGGLGGDEVGMRFSCFRSGIHGPRGVCLIRNQTRDRRYRWERWPGLYIGAWVRRQSYVICVIVHIFPIFLVFWFTLILDMINFRLISSQKARNGHRCPHPAFGRDQVLKSDGGISQHIRNQTNLLLHITSCSSPEKKKNWA